MEEEIRSVEKEGIVLRENMTDLEFYTKPYLSKHYVIVITHRGTVKASYDSELNTYLPNSISVLYPNHTVQVHRASGAYCCTFIVVAASMLDEPLLEVIDQNRYRYEPQPDMLMQKHEYNVLMNIVSVMRETIALDIPDKRNILTFQLRTFLQLLNHYRKCKLNDDICPELLSSQFLLNIAKHYREHRDVQFYAELAGLTPKHFSSSIKKESGHTAAYWIHAHVVSEAKTLLRLRRDIPVQTIAGMIGFEEQATFSRYFKRETGISPKDYRDDRKKKTARTN